MDARRSYARPRAAWALCVLGLAACGGTSSATSSTPTPQPTPQGPSGPPVAQATLTGDTSVSGALHITDVTCADPGFAGSTIVANATNATPQLAIRLTVGAGSVVVQLDTGAGASYRERDFAGSGVSGFAAGSGATVNASLHETTSPNGNIGSIGHLSSVTATIDCAHQTPGSGSFTITGTIAQGVVASPLTATRVTCSPAGGAGTYGMHAVGFGTVGSQPAFIGIFANVTSSGHYASATVSPENASVSYFFTSTANADVTLSTTSAHIDAAVTEPYAPRDTLHVTGDATCGSTILTSG